MSTTTSGYTNPNDGRPKRKRLAKACDACHKSKRRCDGVSPCANCFFASKTCTYTDNNGRPVPAPRALPEQPTHPQHPHRPQHPQQQQQQQQQSQQQPFYPVATKRHRLEGSSEVQSVPSPSTGVDQRSRVPMELEPSLARELINIFFTHCHPMIAVIHRPSFTNTLALNRVPHYLLFAICALGARFSKQPSLSSVPSRLRGRHFANEAMRLMFEDQDGVGRLIVPTTLPTAQALLLLTVYEILAADYQTSSAYSNKGKEVAIEDEQWARGERYRDLTLHVVQILGVHSPDHPLLTPVPSQAYIETSIERECARRVFWMVYILDVQRGVYYRWETRMLGSSGRGYANANLPSSSSGNSPASTSSTGSSFPSSAPLSTMASTSIQTGEFDGDGSDNFSFSGPASTPRQPLATFAPPISQMALAAAAGMNGGVMGFSEAELRLRLPVDETSFELGAVHESLPEYLYLPPIRSHYSSELGHLIRVMTINHKVEWALSELSCSSSSLSKLMDTPSSSYQAQVQENRSSLSPHPQSPSPLQSLTHPPNNQNSKYMEAIRTLSDCSRILDEWVESLPPHLKFNETNLSVQKSMLGTASNMGAWSFACLQGFWASCELALAVGFRGEKVEMWSCDSREGDGEKVKAERKPLETLNSVLEFMGERARNSMMLGVLIWPLIKYLHREDDQIKTWVAEYEDFVGVRMTDICGVRWGVPCSSSGSGDEKRPTSEGSHPPSTHLSSTDVEDVMQLSLTLGAGDMDDSDPNPGTSDTPSGDASELQRHTTAQTNSLPSLKSSGLLELHGAHAHHSSVSQSQMPTALHNIPPPVTAAGGNTLPSQVTAAQVVQSQTLSTAEGSQRVGLSWLMNS